MKKEYYLFFTFVLAAALITGSTLGMIGNIKYILSKHTTIVANQAVLNSSVPTKLAQQSDNTNATVAVPVHSETNNEADLKGNDPTQTVLISPDEQIEVNRMLNTVDSSESNDYNQRIIKFQEKHSLSVTGVLDAQTLGILIQQAKLQKTYQRLNP